MPPATAKTGAASLEALRLYRKLTLFAHRQTVLQSLCWEERARYHGGDFVIISSALISAAWSAPVVADDGPICRVWGWTRHRTWQRQGSRTQNTASLTATHGAGPAVLLCTTTEIGVDRGTQRSTRSRVVYANAASEPGFPSEPVIPTLTLFQSLLPHCVPGVNSGELPHSAGHIPISLRPIGWTSIPGRRHERVRQSRGEGSRTSGVTACCCRMRSQESARRFRFRFWPKCQGMTITNSRSFVSAPSS